MITDAQRALIATYYPGTSPRDALRRQVLETLTDAVGELPATVLAAAVGCGQLSLRSLCGNWLHVLAVRIDGQPGYRLAAGMRQQLGLDVLDGLAAGYEVEPCLYCHERRCVAAGTTRVCDACGRRWQVRDEVAEAWPDERWTLAH